MKKLFAIFLISASALFSTYAQEVIEISITCRYTYVPGFFYTITVETCEICVQGVCDTRETISTEWIWE